MLSYSFLLIIKWNIIHSVRYAVPFMKQVKTFFFEDSYFHSLVNVLLGRVQV